MSEQNIVPATVERPSDALADALALLDARLQEATDTPDDPTAFARLGDLLKEKAALLARLEQARLKEAKADAALARQGALSSADEAALVEGIKADVRELLADWDLHFVLSTSAWWLYDPAKCAWTPLRESQLRMIDPVRLRDKRYFLLFDEVLREEGRWYRDLTATFGPVPPHVLNQIRPQFAPPQTGEHHWVLDMLMTSLGGGKQENSEHIEKVVLAKYRNPANYVLPTMALHDPVGGSGKSLFVSGPLSTLFGPSLVADNLSMRDITGQFNAHICGKAVWFVNEAVEDKTDENALKRTLGSKVLWVEPKGFTKFPVENTALVIVAGNSPTGAVKVANSEVDRRISVIRPTRPLKAWIAEHLGVSDAEATAWLRDEGIAILSDRTEVGRWIAHLERKHGPIDHVDALHGADYRELVAAQQPFHERVFEAVFRDFPGFAYIRKPLLYMLYKDMSRDLNSGYGVLKNRSLYEHLKVWAGRERIALSEKNVK